MEIFPKNCGRNSDKGFGFLFAFHMKRFSKAQNCTGFSWRANVMRSS
ncbi:hypothetical protein LEP1GSC133_1382 [Leptospira borgpetersenii serovar Pomona str. 200901868]|uniref:Uncharacterized protein n=1 Tax=Leptospira borgpetersenii serovar Pomona str. 200901868 TaxID=1192866 RepID=M6VUG4_LEPBO|nr:hypothetical protein LEP1GSC133_1382 [Leptospira borgpetersenii serovar Pomona str. 200901868]